MGKLNLAHKYSKNCPPTQLWYTKLCLAVMAVTVCCTLVCNRPSHEAPHRSGPSPHHMQVSGYTSTLFCNKVLSTENLTAVQCGKQQFNVDCGSWWDHPVDDHGPESLTIAGYCILCCHPGGGRVLTARDEKHFGRTHEIVDHWCVD